MKLIQNISTFFIALIILLNTVYLKDETSFLPKLNEETRIVQHSDFGDFCKHFAIDEIHKCDYNCSTSKIKNSAVKHSDNTLTLISNYYLSTSHLILNLQLYLFSDFRAPPNS